MTTTEHDILGGKDKKGKEDFVCTDLVSEALSSGPKNGPLQISPRPITPLDAPVATQVPTAF